LGVPAGHDLAECLVCSAGCIGRLSAARDACDDRPNSIQQAHGAQNAFGPLLYRVSDEVGYRNAFMGGGGPYLSFKDRVESHAVRA
jgi:hypothetical protein